MSDTVRRNLNLWKLTLVLDFPHQQMDGDVYEDLRSHFTLLCGTEMDTCLTIHKQYSRIWESVAKVCECVCVCHIFNILIYLEIWVCSNRTFNYVSVFWWSGLEGILCHIHRIIITIITTSFIDQTADGHTGCSLTGLQKSMCVQTFVNCLNFIHAKYPTVAPQKWDISHLVSRRGGGGGLKARWQKRTNKRRAPCLRETLAETDVFLFAGTSRF